MKKLIRIGTRGSNLALWQAGQVKQLLEEQNIATEIIPVKSEGDIDLMTPIYAMDVQGVFTKTLDAYLLSNKIDIAVHSMKDVPTQLARGIIEAAVLKRASTKDIFIPNPAKDVPFSVSQNPITNTSTLSIASGSVRRKAQWLHHFPNTTFENLRGNVQTRMRKLSESNWDGIIMAKAGLERVNLLPKFYEDIDWMLPAPAQGAILIVCKEEDIEIQKVLNLLNDKQTQMAVQIERDFLKTLMGGCSTPIGALAQIKGNKIIFQGNIVSPNGEKEMEISKEAILPEGSQIGKDAAKELLSKGANKIVEEIRKAIPKVQGNLN